MSCSDFCTKHVQQSECHSVLDSYYSATPAFACDRASLKTHDCDTVPAEADAGKYLCRCASPLKSLPFVSKATTVTATTVTATAVQTSSSVQFSTTTLARKSLGGGSGGIGGGDDASTKGDPAASTDKTDEGSSKSTAGVTVGATLAAVAALAALGAAFIWHPKKNQGAVEEWQHDRDEQVHVNRTFNDGNYAEIDDNAGGGAPTPSVVYAEAVTHNEFYTYAPMPPPTERQGAPAAVDKYVASAAEGNYAGVAGVLAGVAAAEPAYAVPQDDYAALEGGNTTYSSSA